MEDNQISELATIYELISKLLEITQNYCKSSIMLTPPKTPGRGGILSLLIKPLKSLIVDKWLIEGKHFQIKFNTQLTNPAPDVLWCCAICTRAFVLKTLPSRLQGCFEPLLLYSLGRFLGLIGGYVISHYQAC